MTSTRRATGSALSAIVAGLIHVGLALLTLAGFPDIVGQYDTHLVVYSVPIFSALCLFGLGRHIGTAAQALTQIARSFAVLGILTGVVTVGYYAAVRPQADLPGPMTNSYPLMHLGVRAAALILSLAVIRVPGMPRYVAMLLIVIALVSVPDTFIFAAFFVKPQAATVGHLLIGSAWLLLGRALMTRFGHYRATPRLTPG